MPKLIIDPGLTMPDENLKLSSIQEKLNAAVVTAKEFIETPPICFEIMDGEFSSEIGTLGNISLWIGKAKQGKTFAMSMALAAAELGEWLMSKLKITLPQDRKNINLFDTEQSRFHLQRVIRRVAKLSNRDEPVNLTAYGLRKYAPLERLELIEYALYNTTGLGFVVIDGIRDLITSINDEEQSSMITSKLLKWSEELNIHIAVVLHTNKGDNNARGHLGSELTNKAESVISVGKDEQNADQMIIKPEYCRSKEFIPFCFKIDEYGVPYISELPLIEQPAGKKALAPVDVAAETHSQVLDAVFRLKTEYKYGELQDQIKDFFMRFGIKFGQNKAREFITFYLNDAWMELHEPPKGFAVYRRLKKELVQKPHLNGNFYVNDHINTLDNDCPF